MSSSSFPSRYRAMVARKRKRSTPAIVVQARRPGIRKSLTSKVDKIYHTVQYAKIPAANVNATAASFNAAAASGDAEFVGLAASAAFMGMSFLLSDLPNQAAFTLLFDQYKITKIQVKFQGEFNSSLLSTGPAATGVGAGSFYGVYDRDDNQIPTSLDYLREYDNCRDCRTYQSMTFTFKPNVALGLQIPAGTLVAAGNQKAGWIDAAAVNIPHYGIKVGLPQQNAAAIPRFIITAKYWVSWKNLR